MPELTYRDETPALADALPLYAAVGWSAYTRDPSLLEGALAGSGYVTTARDGVTLLGLARCISDDASVWFLQDLLVAPDTQGKGVGAALLRRCMERYAHVPRGVLLTDAEGPVSFYAREGWADEPRIRTLLAST